MKYLTNYKDIFGSDLRTLALFRIGLGLLILADLINRSTNLIAHYTDFGVLPRDIAIENMNSWRVSIHLANGSATFEAVLFLIAAIFACCLLLGYKTRLATIVSWFLLLSLQNRNFLVLQGGDNLLLLLLFWGMFLPLGARYSIDSLLNKQSDALNNQYSSFASMALKLQCMSVYFFSAILKTGNEWVPDGTAIFYALSLDQFATPLGVWFRDFDMLLQYLTIYVWYLQLIGPFFMFFPVFHFQFRLLMMFCFISMHVSFIFFLEIGLFPYISILSLLSFMPGQFWDKLALLVRKNQNIVGFYYNPDVKNSFIIARLARAFLMQSNLPIYALDDKALKQQKNKKQPIEKNYIIARTRDDKFVCDLSAVKHVLASAAVFKPLLLMFESKLMQNFYNTIVGLVSRLPGNSRNTDFVVNQNPISLSENTTAKVAVIFFMSFVLYWNITTLPQVKHKFPNELQPIKHLLRLDQIWNMFAPFPSKEDGWYVIEGKLKDGTVVDVYNNRRTAPDHSKPEYVSKIYPNQRWRKFMMRTWVKTYSKYRLHYGKYLCRNWNQHYRGNQQLEKFTIRFYLEITKPRGTPLKVEPKVLWNHLCFKK